MITKKKRIQAWVNAADKVWELRQVAQAIDCSRVYVSATIEQVFKGRLRYYKAPAELGNYRNTYFPLAWTDAQCRAYMASTQKAEAEKAVLHWV